MEERNRGEFPYRDISLNYAVFMLLLVFLVFALSTPEKSEGLQMARGWSSAHYLHGENSN